MDIDVRATPTERLREEEIRTFFTPSNKFADVTEEDTIYLIGPRGSGKSMILNYLSTPVQLERYKSDSLIQYDKNNLGIYIRCTEHYFGSVKETLDNSGNPTELWQKKFMHLFNLTACELILRDLERMKNYPLVKIDLAEEQNICNEISSMLGINDINCFHELKSNIRKMIQLHSVDINVNSESPLTINSFLSELQKIINDQTSNSDNRSIVILLDEYHELSYFQQQVINEIISVRRPIFKIATLPPELSTQRQQIGKSIYLLSDFTTVDIGIRNLTPNSPEFNNIKNFFKKIANKRLQMFGYDIEEFLAFSISGTTTKDENDYSGLNNFVLLSSGNPRFFLKLLHAAFKEWNGIGKVSVIAQNIAVKKLASQLIDGIEFIPRISPYVFRSVILKIGLLFKNYFKETRRNYLQIGIKDPENLSEETIQFLFLAIEKNYLMAPAVERYSRSGFKLLSITLSNTLLPYFGLPLKTHQVYELSSSEVEKLISRRSVVTGTKILLEDNMEHPDPVETLDPYLGTIQEIVEHVKNKELTIFIGSGLSTELGYPTGSVLAKKMANHFNLEYVGDDLQTIAARVLEKRERGDLIKFVRKTLEKSRTTESHSYKKLADLELDEIFTTNWDNAIEDEFRKKHPSTEKIVMDEHLSIVGNRKPLVFKIHGDFDHPNLFVITNDDSTNIENTRRAIVTSLENSLVRKHFLFLGYSMEDLDFNTIFRLVRNMQGKLPLTSYATAVDAPVEKLKVLKDKGIISLPMTGGKLIDVIHRGVMLK